MKSSFKKFNRFSMRGEKNGDLELGPSVGFTDTVTMNELVRGFDNPMYADVPGARVRTYNKHGLKYS